MPPTQPPPGERPTTALAGDVGGESPTPPPGAGAPPAADVPLAAGETAAPEDPFARRGRARRGLARLLPAPLWRIGKLLVVALLVEYFVVPQIAGTRKAWHQLSQVNPFLLVVGVVLEMVAITCYAQLTRSVLPRDKVPPLWTLLRIQLTTLSVSHCVPGGTAAGSGLGYRLMTNAGVSGSDVGFALGTQALGSAVVLNVILWLALIVSIPVWGFSPLYLTAALVGVLLMGLFGALILLLTRGEHWATALLLRSAERVPFIDGAVLGRLFEQMASRLRELLTHRSRLARSLLWATANWLLDAASLYVFVGAFGRWVNPDGLLVSYALANVLAAIPLTPGGLGVVEATLTSTLVGFNTPRAIAILGVVSYRLVNFWLPIPVGGLAYLSLQFEPGAPGRTRRLGRRAKSKSQVPPAA
jgi:uncharacterized protein (TIRG00374 family)